MMDCRMDLGMLSSLMGVCMKGIGLTATCMAEESSLLQTVLSTLEISNKAPSPAMGYNFTLRNRNQ